MNREWWRDAVVYQVYVRSFADGDGDGIGDLPGARSRLPYLADLGVDAVWLTPFYTSPMADGGYDVADYRDVDPLFGTLNDAASLISDAHELGLRVIVDIVPNHSSDRHEWFRAGLRDRYIFRPGRGEGGEFAPNDWESLFGGPAWTRVPDGSWYLHLFDPHQPDLNWDNPEVHAEFLDILRFWLDLGVDGFRVDVAHGMVKAPGLPDVGHPAQSELLGAEPLPYFDQDGVHDIYRAWRQVLDEYPGDRMGVAEAWAPNAERTALYVRPDELHQAFNFHFLKASWQAESFRTVIDETLAASEAPPTWVLSNHDVHRHVTRYGGGETGRRRARAAAMLMLALPGSAYVYQGEELGLPEVLDLPEEVLRDPTWERSGHTVRGRDGCRVPIPWTSTGPSLGFSEGTGWLPQPEDWAKLSVAEQRASPDSMLSLYRAVLRLRRTLPFGDFEWLDQPPDVLGFRRGDFHCVVNFGASVVRLAGSRRMLMASSYYGLEGGEVLLPPDTALWWA
ncbi:glycoside hydrolase family 13 protein [Actinophytocola sp.]|uniref:glycoside hydrolase family 13 protein n=1 Tax=Actinophytocola sp. TaxID=1872138 RepID=UPI002D2E2F5C|nr:glycoside hydrolase family 13 protein [Actinophytocola sp.]HYQ68631.1 glycoside hydrolase family 13 protein [Actinophytocola sp.]